MWRSASPNDAALDYWKILVEFRGEPGMRCPNRLIKQFSIVAVTGSLLPLYALGSCWLLMKGYVVSGDFHFSKFTFVSMLLLLECHIHDARWFRETCYHVTRAEFMQRFCRSDHDLWWEQKTLSTKRSRLTPRDLQSWIIAVVAFQPWSLSVSFYIFFSDLHASQMIKIF